VTTAAGVVRQEASRDAVFSSAVDNERRSRDLMESELERVALHPDRIEIVCRDPSNADAPSKTLTVPWTKPSFTRRREILQPDSSDGEAHRMAADERVRLLRAIATARRWLDELITGSVAGIATLAVREKKSERSVRMTLSLAFLDPALIRVAAQGRLPRGYGVSCLADLPARFEDQWRVLGLARPA
jgi:site-specific DNA recombinase